MDGVLRKSIFAVPFGCLVAIASHFVRFGDEHAFGGPANEALVSGAAGGAIAIALAILHAFVCAGSTRMTGTLAAKRMRELIPGAPAVFLPAAGIYYGIEALEGNGLEIGLPTVVLAVFSIVLAFALRRLAALMAHVMADLINDWLAYSSGGNGSFGISRSNRSQSMRKTCAPRGASAEPLRTDGDCTNSSLSHRFAMRASCLDSSCRWHARWRCRAHSPPMPTPSAP